MTSMHPAAAGLDYLSEIARHSAGLADAAESNLDAAVQHCPGWTVADLVGHVWQVHRFWNEIAETRPAEPPSGQPSARPAEGDLLAEFRAGSLRLIETLRAADQQAVTWTWAPSQQNIAFITRHQVQEAAVHHWDAEHAAGRELVLDLALAIDSIEEFLTFSVSSSTDHPDSARPDLPGDLVLRATDTDATWTVSADELPGTVRFRRGAVPGAVTLSATASDLLLWLYQRKELSPAGSSSDQSAALELVTRFRGLCFTD